MQRYGRRALLAALAVLASGAVRAQSADDLTAYSLRRVEVNSSARFPASLADAVRDALARRLAPGAGMPATVVVTLARSGERDGALLLWAIVAVRDDATGRQVFEFDVQATTNVPSSGSSEALQAEALADSIAQQLTAR